MKNAPRIYLTLLALVIVSLAVGMTMNMTMNMRTIEKTHPHIAGLPFML